VIKFYSNRIEQSKGGYLNLLSTTIEIGGRVFENVLNVVYLFCLISLKQALLSDYCHLLLDANYPNQMG